MIRRDWLYRQVQAGNMEARCDFHFDAHYEQDTAKKVWRPARLSDGYGDFIEGVMNFRAFDFRTNSGCAYGEKSGIIHLVVHSNSSYSLRRKA